MTGNFETTIDVPNTAKIGKAADITAVPQVNRDAVTDADAVSHSTPDPTVSLNPSSAVAGQTITVSGENYKPFTAIDKVEIGETDVTPSLNIITDALGSFANTEVTVPLINANRYLVKVTAKDDGGLGNEYLNVVETVEEVVTDPAEVFAGLGDRLVRVWYLDRATQVWSFYDPDPDFAAFNTLNEVSSGLNVSIIISEGEEIEFQGMTLYQGTNPISLD